MEIVLEILNKVWQLTNEMSPFLLLGFLLAGILHTYLPSTLYTRHLGGNSFRSVFLAALFGVPLPLCSCGVIPTAMGLRREGASKGATVSFLIATPQTGIDSIVATYSLMGLPFAIIRPIAAFLTAILGGTLCNKMETDQPTGCTLTTPVTEGNCCSHEHSPSPSRSKAGEKACACLNYAFVEMMEDIGKWLIIGLVIAGIITAAVPDAWFVAFQGNTLYSILFVLLFSIPMYLCATGSIPIALALMMKGLTPGAALVLLMAGPASNVASILVINKVLGRKTLAVYLFSIVAGAILFALGIDYLLPQEWFSTPISYMKDCCNEQSGWFNICCTILMILLLIHALSPWKIFGQNHCHCGSCATHHHHHAVPAATVFHVKGMKCHHCAANVQKALSAVEGVTLVTVSLEEGKAEVDGNFKETDIHRAIESLGFEVVANPTAGAL